MHLQMKLTVDCPYLAGEGPDGLGPALRQITVFHCGDVLRGRAVYGIHMPITGRHAPHSAHLFCGCASDAIVCMTIFTVLCAI